MKCYLNICQDFFEAKDTLAFYNTLNSVIKKNPSNKENYYMAGVICNFVAQNDSALAYFDRALALDSLNATSLILKAQIMNEMGNEEEYEDMYDELLDRFREPPKAVMNLLRIALLRGHAKKAYIQ